MDSHTKSAGFVTGSVTAQCCTTFIRSTVIQWLHHDDRTTSIVPTINISISITNHSSRYLSSISKTVDIRTFFGKYNGRLVAICDVSDTRSADTLDTADTSRRSIADHLMWKSNCDRTRLYYSSRGRESSGMDREWACWQSGCWRTDDIELELQLHTQNLR